MSEGVVSGPERSESWMRRGVLAAVAGAVATFAAAGIARAQDDADIAGGLQDAIVGAWAGQAAQPEKDPFEVRLTFVSPKGGVSRYPGDPPCGGMLVGDRKGDAYEFKESITYGGTDEKSDGCLSGTMNLAVEGDVLKYEWTSHYNGQDFSSTGELKRQAARKKR
jgi:hypothetical protein